MGAEVKTAHTPSPVCLRTLAAGRRHHGPHDQVVVSQEGLGISAGYSDHSAGCWSPTMTSRVHNRKASLRTDGSATASWRPAGGDRRQFGPAAETELVQDVAYVCLHGCW